MTPTTAPTVEITFAGEKRILKFGFLAYKAMNLNPFDPASIEAFRTRPLSVDVVGEVIHAGLKHEYCGKGATRKGQPEPTVEDVIAELDMFSFVPIWNEIEKAMGTDEDEEPKAEQTGNPPLA